MAGVEAEGPGSGRIQATFSVFDHFTGRFFSGLEPSKFGPRHWGQFAAMAATPIRAPTVTRVNLFMRIFDSTANPRRFIHRGRLLPNCRKAIIITYEHHHDFLHPPRR